MFDIDELLSNKNQREALAHLAEKKDSCGADGMYLSELPGYWEQNKERIFGEIRSGTYVPGMIKTTEIINGQGKVRVISTLNTLDRFLARMLAQKLRRYLDPLFLEQSHAYQEGKGVLTATNKAKEYIEQKEQFLVEIDIKNFFDTIPLERLLELIATFLTDEKVLQLIRVFLYCTLWIDDEIVQKEIGLVQGNPISPILSNLYLHSLDSHMEQMKYHWIRFSDNIYVFCRNRDQAQNVFNHLNKCIPRDYQLQINQKKSGIYDAFQRVILGYDFFQTKSGVEIRKHKYDMSAVYHNWQRCKVQKVNKEYHIVECGILTKKDYALLFENETEKVHIPVEAADQLNFYNDVTISSNVLRLLSQHNIKMSFFDKYGALVGTYLPTTFDREAATFLKQIQIYDNAQEHLALAKKMEHASIYNMRANLKYYNKKEKHGLESTIEYLSLCMKETNEGKTLNELLLIEARARQKYYQCFNEIISVDGFRFEQRSKQPPLDAINAVISFGNTLLYNEFLRIIQMTSVNPKIGVVHATNRRSYSLNLDFADIFKPIIVDRVIFSLANCHKLRVEEHFEGMENGAVLLNKAGKRIFLQEFQNKLETNLNYKGKNQTYQNLMVGEVKVFGQYIEGKKAYKPYKYY